jgi:hypothetical protein
VNPDIAADDVVRWRDYDDAAHEWASLADLAADWWRYQRLSEREQDADPMIAWECVEAFVGLDGLPHHRALEVIQALLDQAENDFEVVGVGAGPLEDLVEHSGHGVLVLDDVEAFAQRNARWRRAVNSLYLGDDLPQQLRDRLLAFRSEPS